MRFSLKLNGCIIWFSRRRGHGERMIRDRSELVDDGLLRERDCRYVTRLGGGQLDDGQLEHCGDNCMFYG